MEIPQIHKIIRNVIEQDEGGWVYTDHPNDPDQGTWAGVRFITYKNFVTRHNASLKNLTPADYKEIALSRPKERETIIDIYYEEYFKKCGALYVPDSMKQALFSHAVLTGVRKAVRSLQRAVNKDNFYPNPKLIEDGIFGEKTRKQLEKYISEVPEITMSCIYLEQYFCHFWMQYLIHVVESNPSYLVFLEGWFNRVERYRL